MPDYDVITIGAGHNGLAASTFLAKEGLKTINFEKNALVGGLASTREIIPGYKHNVGAWCWMVFGKRIAEALELEKYGLEMWDPIVSTVSIGTPGEAPYVQYNDLAVMWDHLSNDHGPDAAEALMNLYEYMRTIGVGLEYALYAPPVSISRIMELMPSAEAKDVLRTCFYQSVADIINKFFPEGKYNNIKGSMAAMAIDGMYSGPMTPGSAWSLAYHMAMSEVGESYKIPKGGMISISKTIQKNLEAHGGIVKCSSGVRKILIENGTAVGVELEDGQRVTAKVVVSNADPCTTATKLVGEDQLPSSYFNLIKGIKFRNPFMQVFLALSEPPQYAGELEFLNKDKRNFLVGVPTSVEYVERAWDECKYGDIPRHHPLGNVGCFSLYDPTFAPEGCYSATMCLEYFPPNVSREQHDKLKEEYADICIDQITKYAPNFKNSIIDRVCWGNKDYETLFHVTNGEFDHGTHQIDQFLDFRPMPGWTNYRTPVKNLYLCGSGNHPGGGVTAVPAYNCANEVIRDWKKK